MALRETSDALTTQGADVALPTLGPDDLAAMMPFGQVREVAAGEVLYYADASWAEDDRGARAVRRARAHLSGS